MCRTFSVGTVQAGSKPPPYPPASHNFSMNMHIMNGQVLSLVPVTSVPGGTLVQLNRTKAQSNYEDPLGPQTHSVATRQSPGPQESWDGYSPGYNASHMPSENKNDIIKNIVHSSFNFYLEYRGRIQVSVFLNLCVGRRQMGQMPTSPEQAFLSIYWGSQAKYAVNYPTKTNYRII